MTRLELAERCQTEGEIHLANVGFEDFGVYSFAYDYARGEHNHPALPPGCDVQASEQAFRSQIPDPASWPSNNLFSAFLNMKHQSRKDAFREWISTCQRYPMTETPPLEKRCGKPFLELVTEHIRNKPDLYLGTDPSASRIWSLFSGYIWAERDLGIFPGPTAEKLFVFQSWFEQRFPFSKGYPWNRALDVMALGYTRRSLEFFYSSFDVYLAGGKPDDLGTWAKKMAVAMTAGDPSKLTDSLKQVIRRISPQ